MLGRIAAAIALALGVVFSQVVQGATAPQCELLARDGVLKRSALQQSTYSRIVLLALLTTMNDEEGTETLAHTGRVSVGPISIGPGTWDDTKRRELKSDLSKMVNIDQVLASQFSLVTSSGDPTIVKGIVECIKLNGGLLFSLQERGLDKAEIELMWSPFPTAPDVDPSVIDFFASSGSVLAGKIYTTHGQKIGRRVSRAILLSRDPTKDLSVLINTEGGSATGYLPPSKWPDRMVCRIEFGEVRSEIAATGLSLLKDDCISAAKNAGASDVRLGCQSDDSEPRFAVQRFCVADGVCMDHIPPADEHFGPQPNCGWQ